MLWPSCVRFMSPCLHCDSVNHDPCLHCDSVNHDPGLHCDSVNHDLVSVFLHHVKSVHYLDIKKSKTMIV